MRNAFVVSVVEGKKNFADKIVEMDADGFALHSFAVTLAPTQQARCNYLTDFYHAVFTKEQP